MLEQLAQTLQTIQWPEHLSAILTALALALSAAGIAMAAHAVLSARSPEGAVAWALSLIFFPLLSIPLYWIFGRNKFDQYVEAIRDAMASCAPLIEGTRKAVAAWESGEIPGLAGHTRRLFEAIAPHPFTKGNKAKLLVDGEATFKEIFDAIEEAKESVLVEYYMFRHDDIGKEFAERLVLKAREGVQVHFIYDEIGSGRLPDSFVEKMRASGIQVSGFDAPNRGWSSLRINFRNHRKIVVVDGATAFLGGLNVGDEYLSRDPEIGCWRDTHLRIDGPAALAVQSAFLTDLAWASDYPMPKLSFEPEPAAAGATQDDVLVMPSGPTGELEACSLFFIESICSARQRLWLATPYFVPDDAIVKALQLAACRGVEIKLVLPGKSDNKLVAWASLTFLEELNMPNIKFLRYEKGFMHHKVMLVDDKFASIGTANCDNRSFRLNFEIGAVVAGARFAKEVEKMLLKDFESCSELDVGDYLEKNPAFRVLCQTARLLSPTL